MRRIVLAAVICLTMYQGSSQTIINRDPAIEQMVREVAADSLRLYVQQMASFGTRHTLSVQNNPVKGIGGAREWVLSKFKEFARLAGGRLMVAHDTVTILPDGKRVDVPVLLGNVMATLKGTDARDDRIFIISGHLDSRASNAMDRVADAPGANDDASGVAAVLECARIMCRSTFAASVIFVAVSGEEQSLLGSTHLANKAKKEGWNVVAMLNNDIIGSNNSNGTNIIDNTRVRVFSEGLPAYGLDKSAATIRSYGLENDGSSRQLARYVKETGERYVDNLEVVMIYRNDRFLRGGDHTPFVQNGYPAVRLTEMNENYDHQHQDVRVENGIKYGDLAEFIDFEYLRKNTAVNLAALANLANSPFAPQEVKMDVKELRNSTSLSWKPGGDARAKGYYVLVRETTSPVWQRKFYTPYLEMDLPYSKDNYLFAVQSVSEEGYESLPVLPTVSR